MRFRGFSLILRIVPSQFRLMDLPLQSVRSDLVYKTELLIVYSRFRLPPRLPSIEIGTSIIKPTNKARNIGVIFDNL